MNPNISIPGSRPSIKDSELELLKDAKPQIALGLQYYCKKDAVKNIKHDVLCDVCRNHLTPY